MKKIILSLFAVLFLFSANSQTIAEIHGTGDDSPFADQVVSTSGIVTGIHNAGYFIQDGTEIRSGIYVFDNTQTPSVGDEISLTGTVSEYFNLTELVDITAFEVLSSGNELPAPIELSTSAANNEDYEGMLVKVNAATCTNTDLGFGEWEVNDGSGTLSVDDLLYLYTPLLNIDYSITGPLTYTFSQYKILPRSEDDVIIDLDLFFTETPKETAITTNSISLDWETNAVANAVVELGLTDAYELGSFPFTTNSTTHSVTLENLTAGTIYYARISSSDGANTTPAVNRRIATASNSSGKINVYFNHSVDQSVSNGPLAVATSHIIDTIISYIDAAQSTLDVTMYEAENDDIVAAINAAHNRGVTVRVISDDEGNNEAFDNLNEDISYIEGNANGIMHDKFILVDREDVMNSWVMTGSMNHTINNLGWDYNNVICIQDQTLTKAFTEEFQEMWGGDGDTPNLLNLKFGADKSDNTPHCFNVNGVIMELYFSPTDGTAREIKTAIDAAQNELAFAVLVFTENSLGDAVKDAYDRGLDVKGIIDYVEFNGSEFDFLMNSDVNVMDYQNADGSQWPDGPTLHHKYAIIDYMSGDNPLTITGSHNWSASANSIHDENYLFIYDADIANIYYQEFSARFSGMLDAVLEKGYEPLSVFPNPSLNEVIVKIEKKMDLQIIALNGQVIQTFTLSSGTNILDLSGVRDGMYILKAGNFVGKLVKR